MTPRDIRQRILFYEDRYPEFRHLTLQSEVAMIYGTGEAITAWENYTNLKDLLAVAGR
jgi:hypothetical protein